MDSPPASPRYQEADILQDRYCHAIIARQGTECRVVFVPNHLIIGEDFGSFNAFAQSDVLVPPHPFHLQAQSARSMEHSTTWQPPARGLHTGHVHTAHRSANFVPHTASWSLIRLASLDRKVPFFRSLLNAVEEELGLPDYHLRIWPVARRSGYEGIPFDAPTEAAAQVPLTLSVG
jgi:hypothetical protein